MNTTTAVMNTEVIPLAQVESELSRQLREGICQGNDTAPTLRARLSNLVVYCPSSAQGERVEKELPQIVAFHPARVLLLIGEPTPDAPLQATLHAWHQSSSKQKICSEQVTLRASGKYVDQLPFAMRQMLIGDLPTNLWWASPVPPALAGHLLFDLAEHAQQIIYDSIGWTEPARGVVATSAWLPKVQSAGSHGSWRVASDLNWRRLKLWRRTLSQALDPNTAPGAMESITEVLVEHGPHAVIQAWELVSWLAARLGWKVQRGKVEPGIEVSWQVLAAHGMLCVRVRRLSDGPSEVRRVRISCNLGGSPRVLNIAVEKDTQLSVVLEGQETAPRTVVVKQSTLSELIVKQLSDRERDPVFQESMAVAEVFARTVLE